MGIERVEISTPACHFDCSVFQEHPYFNPRFYELAPGCKCVKGYYVVKRKYKPKRNYAVFCVDVQNHVCGDASLEITTKFGLKEPEPSLFLYEDYIHNFLLDFDIVLGPYYHSFKPLHYLHIVHGPRPTETSEHEYWYWKLRPNVKDDNLSRDYSMTGYTRVDVETRKRKKLTIRFDFHRRTGKPL